jgi:hypothetical protein
MIFNQKGNEVEKELSKELRNYLNYFYIIEQKCDLLKLNMGLNITNNNIVWQNSRVTSLCEECHVRLPSNEKRTQIQEFPQQQSDTQHIVDRNAYTAGGQIPHQRTVS